MSNQTNISYADATCSPWFGCTEVSPGCANCYARELTLKYGWAGWGDDAPRVRAKNFEKTVMALNRKASHPIAVNHDCCDDAGEPARAFYRPRIFPSLMDWLDPKVPVEWRQNFLFTVWLCKNVDWLLLSKRIELWEELIRTTIACELWQRVFGGQFNDWLIGWVNGQAPPNVWPGVTVEDNAHRSRIVDLLKIPAAVRWISAEPLLAHLSIEPYLCVPMNRRMQPRQPLPRYNKLDWVVVGGESGKGRRDCGVEAIVDVVKQCQAANVPVWCKQDCASKPGQQGRIPDEIWNLKQLPRTQYV